MENRSGCRLSKSTVLEPVEPVAPRIVTRRGAVAFLGFSRRIAVAIKPPGELNLFSNRQTLFPTQQALSGAVEPPARHSPHDGGQNRCQNPVQPVHQPAMP